MRPGKDVAIAHEKLPRPEMLLPRKTATKIQEANGIDLGVYYLFMRDFRKSEDCESAVKKAAAEKWASLSEAEKYYYELKMLERTKRFQECMDASRERKHTQFDALIAGVPLPEGGEEAQLKRISKFQAEDDAVGQELQKQIEAASSRPAD